MDFTYFGKPKHDEDFCQYYLNNNSRQNKFTIIDGERFLIEDKKKNNIIPRNIYNLEKFNINFPKTLTYNVYGTESDGLYREFLKIRPMKLLYHLDDSSFTLYEPKTKNSGYLQGPIFRRKQIHKKNIITNKFLSWRDFNIGDDINLFGNYYHVASCDEFTRNFLSKNGIVVKPDEGIPLDSWTISRTEKSNTKDNLNPNQNVYYFHFQQMPRQITFYLAWLDDKNDYCSGKLKRTFKMTINSYTDIVTIIEMTPGLEGQLFLKGVRLCYQTSDGTEKYYKASNLYPGIWIEVYKRPMFIYDVEGEDARKYIMEQYGKVDFGNCSYEILEKGPPPKHFEISLKELVFEAYTESLKNLKFLLIYDSENKIVNVYEESKRCQWHKGRPFLEEVDVTHLSMDNFNLKKHIKLFMWDFILVDCSPITKEYLKFRSSTN
uniref:DM10 domain-containing protein n=1 Tax=Strongyloides stercoralis TaxID=6248 RepID=A0A0K0DVN4_STRER